MRRPARHRLPSTCWKRVTAPRWYASLTSYGKRHLLAFGLVLVLLTQIAIGSSPWTRDRLQRGEDTSAGADEGWEFISRTTGRTPVDEKAPFEKVSESVSSIQVRTIEPTATSATGWMSFFGFSSHSEEEDKPENPGFVAFLNPFRDERGRPVPTPAPFYEKPSETDIKSVLQTFEVVKLPETPIMERKVAYESGIRKPSALEEELADAIQAE